jgi:putative endonuclease
MIAGFVYIISNKNKTVLYIGATKFLKKRIDLHISGKATVFTKKYSVNELIFFERYPDFHDAFKREKQLKNWHKDWKWNLIKSTNPDLKNLYLDL